MGSADRPLPAPRLPYSRSGVIYQFRTLRWPVLISLVLLLVGTGLSSAAEIDDSSLFIDAFGAYQAQDYSRALDKIETLQHTFPDSPLGDVTLLLLARSAFKAGDHDRAARAINRLTAEFPASPITSGIEPELKVLGKRLLAGERLPASGPVPRKPSGQHMAPVAVSAPPTEPKTADSKTFADRLHDSVRIVSLSGGQQTVAVGQRGSIPFEIVNPGDSAVQVLLEPVIPPLMDPTLSIAGNHAEIPAQLVLGPGAGSRGAIAFRVPDHWVDGHKLTVSLQALSPKDHSILQTFDTQVVAEAPLVRVIARSERQRGTRNDQARFQVTLLNAGSIPAQNLTIRIMLPPQLEILAIQGGTFQRETVTGTPVITLDTLSPGKLEEFTVSARIRETIPPGQELRAIFEVLHGRLQLKQTFTSSPLTPSRK